MQKQVVVIHGGGNFIPLNGESILEIISAQEPSLARMRRVPDWKATLQDALGASYDVLAPHMPNADAPHYEEWKLWFEKILPLLEKNALFVGHSLGALFLAKYFSESPNIHARAVFLVAAPFGVPAFEWALTTVEKLTAHTGAVFLYHSKDDDVVLFENVQHFKTKLPHATVRELEGRGHFNRDDFPEIVTDIKNL